ncbi:hypothetical protein BOV91_10760, partial [Solemya velum gill symbiont]
MLQADLSSSGSITRIEGPLLFLKRNVNVGLNDSVVVIDEQQRNRPGRITALDDESMIVEVLETTSGLSLS